MKPTSKCPYYSEDEDNDECDETCRYYASEPDETWNFKKCIAFYCELKACDKEKVVSWEEYKYDKEH